MEERKIVISVRRMEALTNLLGSVLGLWESTNSRNPNQCLAIDMLNQGILAVNRIIKNGQLREGGDEG